MRKRFKNELSELNIAGVTAAACGFGALGLLFFFFSVNFFVYGVLLLPRGSVSLFLLMLIVLFWHLLLGASAGCLFSPAAAACGGGSFRAADCCLRRCFVLAFGIPSFLKR